MLGHKEYRNFEEVIEKAKLACVNSGHKIEYHFVDGEQVATIGNGTEQMVKTVFMSRYACYLAIRIAEPRKEIFVQGEAYFADQSL